MFRDSIANEYVPERIVSQQSLRSLDWLNFFKADAQTTVGTYLAIFLLAARHWNLAKIGMVTAIPGFVTMLTQTPAGALVDWMSRKRVLVTFAALGLGAGCLLPAADCNNQPRGSGSCAGAHSDCHNRDAAGNCRNQRRTGRASRFARRMGRNEAYGHAGAVAAAIVAGSIAYWVATIGLFYFAAAMTVAASIAAMSIREEDIDPALAREAVVKSEGKMEIMSLRDLMHHSRIAIFTIAVVLFHLANAAMPPLVGEMLSAGRPTMAVPYMSACIIISQLVMMPIALLAGWPADSCGRKRVFVIALTTLPIRGLLFAIIRNPYLVVSIQILDGVGVGIFGVVAAIIVADLAQHTGRFNLMQGAMNTCVAVGAFLSNLVAGFVAEHKGYGASFILLSALALLALAFFWAAMPETATETEARDNRG